MRFRPVPPQAGHFNRINATPSDLPFKSTGFATYPVPPQFGQSSGLTPIPLSVEAILADLIEKCAADCFALRITNKIRGVWLAVCVGPTPSASVQSRPEIATGKSSL